VHKRRHQDATVRRRLSRHNNDAGHIVCSDDAERRKVNQPAGASGQERPHYLGEFFFLFFPPVSVQLLSQTISYQKVSSIPRSEPIHSTVSFPDWFMTDEAISRQESATEQSQQYPEIGGPGRGPGEQSGGDEQMQVQ
jgi:hypothetical protein